MISSVWGLYLLNGFEWKEIGHGKGREVNL